MNHSAEPRLLLDGDQWEKLAEKLGDPYLRGIAENNRRALELMAQQQGDSITQIPRTLGGELTQRVRPDECRVLKNRLLRSTVAWYLERDPMHLAMVEQVVDYLVRDELWSPVWNKAGAMHADLTTGDLLYSCAFALDVMGRYISDERRTALVAVLTQTGLPAYLRGIEAGDWWRRCDFNWGTALHGQAGFAALAIEREAPELAQRVLREARAGVQYVIERFPPGGGWTEGLMYQATMLGHLTDFVVALSRTHGEDLGLPANRNLADMLDARPYFIFDDGYILNFSNAHERSGEHCLPHAFWWATQLGRPEWTEFEQRHTKNWRDTHGLFHDVEAFWFRPVNPPVRKMPLEPMKHCHALDWFTWRGRRMWLAFRSGFNGGNHNNLDLGQIILGAGKDRFLIDPGYGASATSQHSCVTVRGKEQTDGATAKIFRIRQREDGFYLACDLSAAFPHVLTHYYRHLLMIDDAHLLVVDDLRGWQGRRTSARFHLQTRFPWRREGDVITLEGSENNMTVRLLTGESRLEAKAWTWADLPVTTLVWHDRHDTVRTTHAMLLSVRDEPATYRLNGETLTLELGGRRHVLDLAEATHEDETC